jgi:hypothetical protein
LSRNHERAGHCVALYRKPAYSPQQHLANDVAIMNVVIEGMEHRGWRVTKASEDRVEAGDIPAGDLYLNMCQGIRASERLCQRERDGAVMVNSPTSVLGCHRHQLVQSLGAAGVAFPPTLIVPTRPSPESAQLLQDFVSTRESVWIKRGDVHAECAEDVVRVDGRAGQVDAALDRFAARGIARVGVQEHVAGPVLKFYAVANRSFFRYYGADGGSAEPPPRVDTRRLRSLAFRAAAALGLQVFGGDVALPAPDQPVLIDLNDWPSFAPFRADAGQAIASFAHAIATEGVAA